MLPNSFSSATTAKSRSQNGCYCFFPNETHLFVREDDAQREGVPGYENAKTLSLRRASKYLIRIHVTQRQPAYPQLDWTNTARALLDRYRLEG